jgi:hypothetical protein
VIRPVAGLLALVALGAAQLRGQQLTTGAWHGMLWLGDDDSVAVTATVKRPTGKLQIDIRAPTGLDWGMGHVRERPGRVDFSWALDRPQPLLCRLAARSERRWEGYCEDMVRGADGRFLRLLFSVWRTDSQETPLR